MSKRSARPPLPEPVRAFIAGFTEPSLAALGIGAVIFGLVALWSVQQAQGFVATYPQLLAGSDGDDYAFVTAATMDIANTKQGQPAVAVIGASCLRAATDEVMIERELQTNAVDQSVLNLTTRGQSLWESIAIADYIVPGLEGIVVIDTNPLRFARAYDFLQKKLRAPRLGFRSEILNDLAREAGIPATNSTGIYAWDFRAFYGPRLGNVFPNLINGPATHDHARLTDDATPEQLERMAKAISSELEGYDAGVEVLLEAVSQLISSLADKNSTKVVLIEPPINPDFVATVIGADFYDRHLIRLRQFAKQQNIQFWELHSEIAPAKSDFADWCHLNNARTRKEYSQLLSAYLVSDLGESK